MDELMNELDAVYKAISSIPVTGASVDMMADARARLRKVYAGLENMKEVDANGDGD